MLLRVNEQRNILREIRKRKANWIGHILRRNCLLKQVIEGKLKGEMDVTRRRGRRRKKLLDDLKDRRGYSHLKEEALDHTMWRNRIWKRLWTCRQTDYWIIITIYCIMEHWNIDKQAHETGFSFTKTVSSKYDIPSSHKFFRQSGRNFRFRRFHVCIFCWLWRKQA